MQLEATPLLQTKLDVPPPRAHTLPRERLLASIPDTPGMRLLLLSAPAGFGKTTLSMIDAPETDITMTKFL